MNYLNYQNIDKFKSLDYIGFFGPIILIMVSIIVYWNKPVIYSFYIYGIIVDVILNNVLKHIIAQPRPIEDINIFHAKKTHASDRVGPQQYGMPSGHSQLCAFSTIYVYLSTRNLFTTIIFCLITINTMIQRVHYKNHSVIQVVSGAIVGLVTGSIFYYITQLKMKENIEEKPDIFSLDVD
jgi:membrane-associated phospholipid phosphatase